MAKEKYTGNAKQTWEQWSIKQRRHFLKDHGYTSMLALSDEFSGLPLRIQKSVKQHLKEGKYEQGGNINSYTIGDEVKFYYEKDKEVKRGVITDKTRDEKNFIVTSGTSQIKVEPRNIIEKVEPKKKKKVFGVFKGGGNIWGTDPETVWNDEWDYKRRSAFLEHMKNVNFENPVTLRSKYSELPNSIKHIISEYLKVEPSEKRSSKQLEKEIAELEAEIKKQDEDIARYAKNMEETQATRAMLLEQLNEIKGSNNEPNELMPWQKELTPEEIEFIISAINRYGEESHPTATLENWHGFKYEYVKGVLLKIANTSHLSAEGIERKASIFKKLNIK